MLFQTVDFFRFHTRRQRATALVAALVAGNLFLLAEDGSPLRTCTVLLFLVLPGLAWAELLPPDASALLRLVTGLGLGYAIAILAGLLLHALPGPIALWQVTVAFNLLVLAPALLLLAMPAPSPAHTETGRNRRSLLVPILLLAIVLLGGCFRLAELNYSEYQGDEIKAVAPAARALVGDDNALMLQRRKGPAEVLLPMLVWSVTGVLSEGAARLPFALAGLLLIPTFFVMGRRLLNPTAGLAAALIVALCGLLVAYARVVQYQSIVLWMMALSLLCAWQWRSHGALRWAALAGVFLGVGLLAHYDALAVTPALAYLAAAGVIRGRAAQACPRRTMVAGALAMAGACLLVASPFYIGYVTSPYFGDTHTYLAARLGGQFLADNLDEFLHVTSFYNSFYFVVVTGLLAWAALCWPLFHWRGGGWLTLKRGWARWGLAAAGLVAWLGIWRSLSFQLAAACLVALLVFVLVSRSNREEQRSVLIWGGGAFLALVFVILVPGTHGYVIMGPLALLAGVAAATLWEQCKAAGARWLFVAATAGAVLLFSGYLFAVYLRQDVEYWQDWPASRLSFYWMPEDYANPNNFAIFGMVHRSGWKAAGELLLQNRLATPYDSNEKTEVAAWYTRNAARTSPDEQAYCASPAQTLMIASDLVGSAGSYAQKPAFISGYQPIATLSQPNGKTFTVYSPAATASPLPGPLDNAALEATFDRTATPAAFAHQPQPRHPLDANLGNQVRLLGYDLDCIRRDGRVALTLYWQALTRPSADYHVFVHVEGDSELGGPLGVWGQSDGAPGSVGPPLALSDAARLLAGQPGGDEPLPTSTWHPGQVIRDRRAFQIQPGAPPASYALVAGLYQPATGQRLQLLDANGEPLSDHVTLMSIELPLPADIAAQ